MQKLFSSCTRFVILSLLASPFYLRLQAEDGQPDKQAGNSPPAATVESIAKRARDAVVVISAAGRDGQQRGIGTGFVISKDGLIVTNLHVIGEGRPISVVSAAGKDLKVAAVHASDRHQDLAILRVENGGDKLPALKLADAEEISAGTQIVMLGNPHGLKHSVVAGVVSGTREIDGRDMLQLAVPIEPGNSGGPVLDMQGRVLGVATMKSAITSNLGFAVRATAVQPLLKQPNPIPLARWLTIGVLDKKNWKPLFGANWRQRQGRIVVDGAGAGFGGRSLCLSLQPVPEPPFEVGVSVKLDDEAGAAGLVFHADGDDKHYGFYPSNGRLRLSCFRGPTVYSWQVLHEIASDDYQPGQWNRLKVRVEQDKLLCYVNDQLVIESTDRTFRSGKVGLAKFRQTEAEFKGFRVAEKINSPELDPEQAKQLAKLIDALPPPAELQDAQLRPLAGKVPTSTQMILQQAKALETQAANLRQLAADVEMRAVADRLRKLVEDDRTDFDLFHAGLLVAKLDDSELDVENYIAEITRMEQEIKASLPDDADEKKKLAGLRKYLFEENGFHGSRFDYYHRANSHLNRVIDDREGLPITLSVLFMELGSRLGLNIEGVGLPGHFVVRFVPSAGDSELIDVFEGGKTLPKKDAEELVRNATGGSVLDAYFEASTKQSILERMIRNLLNLAERSSDKQAMLRYLEALVAVDPQSVQHRGMRAVLRFQNGRRDAAIADLDWIIDQAPDGLDLNQIERMRETFSRQ